MVGMTGTVVLASAAGGFAVIALVWVMILGVLGSGAWRGNARRWRRRIR